MQAAPTFEDYYRAYEEKRATAEAKVAEWGLASVERLALKVAYLVESASLEWPEGRVGEVLAALTAKLTNELLGFSGDVRMGALQAAYHHPRAIIELRASAHYVFGDPALTAKRVEQFVEYGRMLPWIKRRRLEIARDSGEITPAEFSKRNLVSDALVAHATAAQQQAWMVLYGVATEAKLLKVRHWHDGSIRDCIDALDPSGETYVQYELMCHPSHVSPVGHRVAGFGAPRLFGYSEAAVGSALDAAHGHGFLLLTLVDDQVGGKLMAALAGEIADFLARRRAVRNA